MLINLVICFWFLGFLFEIVILHPLAFFSEKLNCLKLFCLHCPTVHLCVRRIILQNKFCEFLTKQFLTSAFAAVRQMHFSISSQNLNFYVYTHYSVFKVHFLLLSLH